MESTRLTLRLPSDLTAEVTAQAQAAGVSLNAWLILGVRNWVTYKRREFPATTAPRMPPATGPSRNAPSSAAHAAKTTATPAKAVSGVKSWPKVGRNDPCPCGSGRKWKVCHGKP